MTIRADNTEPVTGKDAADADAAQGNASNEPARHRADPLGIAQNVLAPNDTGQLPFFDWVDAVLMFGGMVTLVALALLLEQVDPLDVAYYGAAPAFFGPVFLRNKLFPASRQNVGKPKEGPTARLRSIAGLLGLALSIFLLFLGISASRLAEPRLSATSFEYYLEIYENGRPGGFTLRSAEIAHDARRLSQGLPEEAFVPSDQWWANYEQEQRADWEAFKVEEAQGRAEIRDARAPTSQRLIVGGFSLALASVLLLRSRYPRTSTPFRPGVANIRDVTKAPGGAR